MNMNQNKITKAYNDLLDHVSILENKIDFKTNYKMNIKINNEKYLLTIERLCSVFGNNFISCFKIKKLQNVFLKENNEINESRYVKHLPFEELVLLKPHLEYFVNKTLSEMSDILKKQFPEMNFDEDEDENKE